MTSAPEAVAVLEKPVTVAVFASYGFGLIAAGVLADRDRRYLFACCAASLVTPFLMLALAGADASSVVLWALGYLLFGFFQVWRITLFADLAAQSGRLWPAGAGLLLGRLGDALGTAVCLALGDSSLVLIAVSSAVFLAAIALLLVLYRRLYVPAASAMSQPDDEVVRLASFARRHGLSEREHEVLTLLVLRKTNVKIAEELFVSEATVKFHVRNILKKTGCSNRGQVIDLYLAEG